jgi:RimJ/RimL family protein N-acetyltransferase
VTSIIRILAVILRMLRLAYINIKSFLFVPSMPQGVFDDLVLRAATYSDLETVYSIYRELNGVNPSYFNRVLYSLLSKKLVVVAISGGTIVGINMYYINFQDFRAGTVHEFFIGVVSSEEGRGIATRMRVFAINYFNGINYKGISTRISENNKGSLRSAHKVGFVEVESYNDDSIGSRRYYLVNIFGCKSE